jgi:hypothetical protein
MSQGISDLWQFVHTTAAAELYTYNLILERDIQLLSPVPCRYDHGLPKASLKKLWGMPRDAGLGQERHWSWSGLRSRSSGRKK